MNYIPDTILLNHAYVPFYVDPIKKIYNCVDDFPNLEIGIDGLLSVINLESSINGDPEQIIPFINMKKYDSESRDWFWYDSNNFPLRRTYDGVNLNLTPIWEFASNYGHIYSINPKNLINGGNSSGFYSEVLTDNGETVSDIKVYTGQPIILTLNEKVIYDKTIYGDYDTIPNLTQMNIENNPEFYYDIDTNKIYTNQNLAGIDPAQIKLYFDVIPNTISVKCRMRGNVGEELFSTPTVDYYLVKLNGQYLRG